MSQARGAFFFFNDTATTEIYALSLHDALPICDLPEDERARKVPGGDARDDAARSATHVKALVRRVGRQDLRSEEHTSELQSRQYLVCRLLLEKNKLFVILPYEYLFTHAQHLVP